MSTTLNKRPLGWIAFVSAVGLVAFAGCANEQVDPLMEADDIASVSDEIWYTGGNTLPSTTVPVCFGHWDSVNQVWTSDLSESTAAERQWVQSAVVGLYSELTPLQFTGWGACSGPDPDGIRVNIGNVGGSVTTGTPTKRNVMLQNAYPAGNNCTLQTPITWYDGHVWASGQEFCITFLSLHEFFHALGAGHEHGRTDVTPIGCTTSCSGGSNCSGNTGYGPFDAYSMSAGGYCTSSTGRLSTTDVAWLQHTYGRTSNDWVWYVDGNPQDIWGPGQGLNDPGTVDADSPGLQANRLRANITPSYVPIHGDFDQDGKADILWSPGGTIWWGRDRHGFDVTPNGYPVGAGFLPVSGDFDHDGRGDVFWYMPGAGNDSIWWGTGNRAAAFNGVLMQVGGGPYQPFAGDFDGNLADDIFWYAPGGTSYIWWGRTNGSKNFDKPATQYNVNAGLAPVTGDFDGDGRVDIWWLNANGVDYMWWGAANRTFSAAQVDAPSFAASTKAYSGNFADFAGVWHAADVYFDQAGPNDEVWVGSWSRGVWQKISASIEVGYTGIVGNFDGLTFDDILWYTPGDAL